MTASDSHAFRPVHRVETRTFLTDIAPSAPNLFGPGTIDVRDFSLTYEQDETGTLRVTARAHGMWRRGTGELTDAPLEQIYDSGPNDRWPDWLADLAQHHLPQW
jgi:hypothetical protein